MKKENRNSKQYQQDPRHKRRLYSGMRRVRLQVPVDQLDRGSEWVRQIVADLCMVREDIPRGVVKSNFERDRGPLKDRGHVWTSAPVGAFVFTEADAGTLVQVVRDDGFLTLAPAEDVELLWKRLGWVAGTSDLAALLSQVESLQAARLHILKELFPEIAGIGHVKYVPTPEHLPESTPGTAEVVSDGEGMFRPWRKVVHLGARKGTRVAVVSCSDRPGHHDAYAVAARA